MIRLLTLTGCLLSISLSAQLAWPSQSWSSAENLTAQMSASDLTDLSGMHWNSQNNRLYLVQNNGKLRVLHLDASDGTFTQICNKNIDGDIEGITQADLSENAVYVIDEGGFKIRKYTHTANFSSVSEVRHWNLLNDPSPMNDTGNYGPEGIVFIPDSALQQLNFKSSVSGSPYTSVKGMGGLMFVANETQGYVWVFDLNPSVNNDFAYVGKYKTSREESCELTFDASTNLLYILHNIDDNYLEVTDLSFTTISGQAKFNTVAEYHLPDPTGDNNNIEGFAMTPKCNDANLSYAWLCRDAESDEDDDVIEDVVRVFSLFDAAGTCLLGTVDAVNDAVNDAAIAVYPVPAQNRIYFRNAGALSGKTVSVFDQTGRNMGHFRIDAGSMDISSLSVGSYLIKIDTAGVEPVVRFAVR
ncbi:T9SS type A sorting domain-containing protein [Flavobacterium silvaticum]|uniref:T9SS type A sorting domain-containing protein n=1 Tax=Flavobacterium silvaticum TaxID=1852020 RepID=A0A972FKV8_9FLAO|nr:T9SS type A sorting domain-containing protein [Flavobacterium silvaticum]NMH27894.1 T9SS type A sorting domain-containing protein [Flavobacterium silvaticum]